MLQERLEGADRSARKKRLTAAVVVVVGLSGFGLWLAEMWVNDRPPAVNPKAAGSGPAPEARKPNAESEPAPAVTDHTAVPVDTHSRERFKEIFGRYLADVEPVILSEAFARWDAGAQREIADMKAAALQAFGEGSHAEALARIEALLAQAREALRLREAAFARALSGALAGLERDDYDGAGLHIAEALRIRPESPEALRLNTRIEGLPKVLAHLDAARVARLENDPQAELRSLENVVRLDPARQAVRGRLGTLVKELRDSRYSRHIARGLAALENKNLGKARGHLVQARQLFPDRAETALLARQVLDLDKVIKVEGLVQRARAAAQADDWSAALDAYRELEGIAPGNEEAVGAAGPQSASSPCGPRFRPSSMPLTGCLRPTSRPGRGRWPRRAWKPAARARSWRRGPRISNRSSSAIPVRYRSRSFPTERPGYRSGAWGVSEPWSRRSSVSSRGRTVSRADGAGTDRRS